MFIFQVVRVGRGGEVKRQKNGPKQQKTLHIWRTIHHMTVIYGTHFWNDNILRYVFHFSKILIFWVYRGVKGQKMVQNGKKLCLLCSISQEWYIIWLSFMVQMCKIIIYPGVFFNVKILIFHGWQGAKRAKNGPKWQKFLAVAPYISGTIHISYFIYCTHVCIKG